jgi:homoserine kinase
MKKLKSSIYSITAFAPATCANIAVGYDILGLAVLGVGDEVTLELRKDKRVVIESIEGCDSLSKETSKNVVGVVLENLMDQYKLPQGFSVTLKKGIPLSSGMGGSAASSVAALVAANGFLEAPLNQRDLATLALTGEALATGEPHADNVSPCVFGGITLTYSSDPLQVIQLPVPNIFCVLVMPALQVDTRQARAVLPKDYPLADVVRQSSKLAGFIVSLYKNDLSLMQQSLEDILIEPHRAGLVKGFQSVKKAAIDASAIGAGLSGSGPCVFALGKTNAIAQNIAEKMQAAFLKEKLPSKVFVSPVSGRGARVIDRS